MEKALARIRRKTAGKKNRIVSITPADHPTSSGAREFKISFVNALTSLYQFTHAVISICPEIPDLDGQTKYFHGGKSGAITIKDNEFDTFDAPLLYAKSVDGLVFDRNIVRTNTEYRPFHPNKSRFLLEKTHHVEIR